ncbi:mitochondrial potassium channel [Rhinophrynus dorsalis]
MKFIGTLHILKGTTKLCHQPPLVLSIGMRGFQVRTYCSSAPKLPDPKPPLEDTVVSPFQQWKEVGKTVARNSMQRVSITAKNWWDRYEEFVGLVEVREAQGKVAEAEKDFMVARGIVRESRESVESQQVKLKEVRDRLDRVSREDIQYLELATLEHKLLQEEKRLRASYVNAEECEREKFSLFSASVRESHEKERTRAERTKNWSIIGSVLGAVIGVMGSTYINRVRLQELKSLLLEAQKGPISLQEAIHEHASIHQSQQKDLGNLIISLRNMVPTASAPSHEPPIKTASVGLVDPVLAAVKEHMSYSKETGQYLESLQQKYSSLEKSISRMATDVQNVKTRLSSQPAERVVIPPIPQGEHGQRDHLQSVILELAEAEQRLGTHIDRNSIYSTALTCTVFALSLPVLYILLKGN